MLKSMLAALPLVVSLTAFQASATPSPECFAKIETKLVESNRSQDAWYSAHGGKAIPSQNRTTFSRGTNNTAVLVLHGFFSSPRAMQSLVGPLKSQGHTVLAPLITGFGGGYEAANASRMEDWQKSVREGIETLRTCFPKVAVVAHCLGGALALDQVLNSPPRTDISEMILIAPYVRTYYPGLNILNDMVKAHVPFVDLRILRLLLGLAPENILPIDLIPSMDSGDDPLFPLQAVESALDFQKKFMPTDATQPQVTLPVTVLVSDADQVIDGRFALEYIGSRFRNLTAVRYAPTAGVPHYMHNPAQNPRFNEVVKHLEAIRN